MPNIRRDTSSIYLCRLSINFFLTDALRHLCAHIFFVGDFTRTKSCPSLSASGSMLWHHTWGGKFSRLRLSLHEPRGQTPSNREYYRSSSVYMLKMPAISRKDSWQLHSLSIIERIGTWTTRLVNEKTCMDYVVCMLVYVCCTLPTALSSAAAVMLLLGTRNNSSDRVFSRLTWPLRPFDCRFPAFSLY